MKPKRMEEFTKKRRREQPPPGRNEENLSRQSLTARQLEQVCLEGLLIGTSVVETHGILARGVEACVEADTCWRAGEGEFR